MRRATRLRPVVTESHERGEPSRRFGFRHAVFGPDHDDRRGDRVGSAECPIRRPAEAYGRELEQVRSISAHSLHFPPGSAGSHPGGYRMIPATAPPPAAKAPDKVVRRPAASPSGWGGATPSGHARSGGHRWRRAAHRLGRVLGPEGDRDAAHPQQPRAIRYRFRGYPPHPSGGAARRLQAILRPRFLRNGSKTGQKRPVSRFPGPRAGFSPCPPSAMGHPVVLRRRP